MLKNHIIGKINLHALLIVLIIFCIFEYGIEKICGFTLYPDEFGYWASAASVTGYDWSEVASLGSYYSFGYSLILIPILKMFSGGVAAYRAAIFVNMLLMCVGFFLFGKMIEEIFPGTEAGIRVLISGAAVLYPAWIFYMQMTMAEAVLIFVFSLIVYVFYKFMVKQSISHAIALAALLIYGYSVHMRTIGVVAACVLVLICRLISEKGNKKALLICFGVLVLLCGITLYLKDRTTATVFSFAGEDSLAINDYSSQWRKAVGILTLDGMKKFAWGVLGKFYYLGMSSFGTFYWALGWCVKESVRLFRIKKEEIRPRQWFALFLLLTVAGQVLISSVYVYDMNEIDSLIYGRYNELFVPVMMMIGIVIMSKSRHLIPVTACMGTILGGVTFLLLRVIEKRNMSDIRGYHVAGISYLLQGSDQDVSLFFRNTWLLGFGLMLLVCAFVWLGRRRTGTWWLYAGIMMIEVAAGIQISNHYTYQTNYLNYEDLMIADMLQEKSEESIDILYLEEGNLPFVDLLQMQIPEETIHVIREDELSSIEDRNCTVITDSETRQDEILREKFDKKVSTAAFCLYYNL